MADQDTSVSALLTAPKEEYQGDDCIRAGELAPMTDTSHHDALVRLSQWRDADKKKEGSPYYGDAVCEHFTLLTHSPAFRSFLEEAIEPVTKLRDPNWNIAWFGAEMFAAGVLATKREAGRRDAQLNDIATVEFKS